MEFTPVTRLRRNGAGAIVIENWASLIPNGVGQLRVQRFRRVVRCSYSLRCVL